MPTPPTNADSGPGVVNFDYKRWFPYIFWVSQWVSDDTYPEGYCYKLLSVRDESSGCVELVVLLTERSGDKQEMKRFSIPTDQAREAAELWLRGLTKRFDLDFEEQDYSAVRNHAEFTAITEAHGWRTQPTGAGNA